MFKSNNRPSFHLWWKENLVKHQQVSKYYANYCGCPNMNLSRQSTLRIEIYKTLNKLNPGYMNDVFTLRNTFQIPGNTSRLTREKYKLNLEIPKPNQATFGTIGLRSYGAKI